MESIFLNYFLKQAKALLKKYPSINNDLAALVNKLESNPQSGTALGADCYKIRLAIASKKRGKSGGARVIICVKLLSGRLYFLSIYDKAEQENIPDLVLAELIKIVRQMEDEGNKPG